MKCIIVNKFWRDKIVNQSCSSMLQNASHSAREESQFYRYWQRSVLSWCPTYWNKTTTRNKHTTILGECYGAMRIKTHLEKALYLSSLWSKLSCAAELVFVIAELHLKASWFCYPRTLYQVIGWKRSWKHSLLKLKCLQHCWQCWQLILNLKKCRRWKAFEWMLLKKDKIQVPTDLSLETGGAAV